MNYTEEKFKVLGVHGTMVEVVKSEITDEDTQEVKTCLRIQPIRKELPQ
jgi:hypothetical protein